MNRLPESSHVPPFVPLRRRRRRRSRRTPVVPTHLLLVAGVWLACVVSAVLVLQEHHRKPRTQLAREVVVPAADAGKSVEAEYVEPPSIVDRSTGQRMWPSDGGKLYTELLLRRVAEVSPTASR